MKKKGAWVVPVSGEKILIRKQDSGKWSFIGGSLQKKERPVDAALRVFHLETGQRLPLVELCGAFMLMDKGARCYYYPTTWEFTAPSGCKWVEWELAKKRVEKFSFPARLLLQSVCPIIKPVKPNTTKKRKKLCKKLSRSTR